MEEAAIGAGQVVGGRGCREGDGLFSVEVVDDGVVTGLVNGGLPGGVDEGGSVFFAGNIDVARALGLRAYGGR